MRRLHLVCMCVGTLLALGCSGLKQDNTIDLSAEQLYSEAKGYMDTGTYQTATEYYTKLLARFPSGTVAQQAMLDLAYTYYKDRKTDEALKELEQFMRLYPNHQYMDYALYLKGVVEYERNVSFFDRIAPPNKSETDQENLKKAFDVFNELTERFPESKYSEDAKYRMIYIRNLIAEGELNVARHYLRTDGYVAALSRSKEVITNYETSPSAPYALAVMVRAYQELGQDALADDTMRVFNANYPKKINDSEIQEILNGDVHDRPGFWQQVTAKPKI